MTDDQLAQYQDVIITDGKEIERLRSALDLLGVKWSGPVNRATVSSASPAPARTPRASLVR